MSDLNNDLSVKTMPDLNNDLHNRTTSAPPRHSPNIPGWAALGVDSSSGHRYYGITAGY